MEGQGTTMKMAFNPFDNHSTSWTNVIDELNTPRPVPFHFWPGSSFDRCISIVLRINGACTAIASPNGV
jgi:hypothetical protein